MMRKKWKKDAAALAAVKKKPLAGFGKTASGGLSVSGAFPALLPIANID
jgi:hypothetical protein